MKSNIAQNRETIKFNKNTVPSIEIRTVNFEFRGAFIDNI